jgi:predicted RNA-binding Zn-ribbon protein involved in translation (DUF1610 family)
MHLQEFYRKRAKHYLGTAIGASASIVCLVGVRSDVGGFLGYTGLMLSTGYGIAVATANQKITQWHPEFERSIRQDESEKWQSKLARMQREWLAKLSTRELELQAFKNALQQAKDAVEVYIGVDEKNKALQEQLTIITQKLEHLQDNFEVELEVATQDNWQGYLERIKARNSEHRARERELLAAFGELEERHKASLSTLVEQYTELIESYESVIGSFHPELESIRSEFSARLQSVSEERDRVYAMLAQYQKPRLFEGNSYAATVGNAVLGFYLENDLIADPVRYESHGSGLIDVWLRPRTGTVEAYEKLGRELFIKQAYLALPKYKVEDGSLKISLKTDISEGRKKSEPSTLNSDWFEIVVSDVEHIRVTGERDSGKSTLVVNLVNLKLTQNPGCQIKLCNPLYGSRKDTWTIPATWKSFDEALEGLIELADVILERNELGRRTKDAGLPTPDFEPILYIFDEIDMTISTHEKPATELLKTCLKMGTHYNVHVIYIGQSPLCSTLGLKRPDLNHSAAFHLGKNVGRAIEDLQASTRDTKDKLLIQYEQMNEQGNKFICLVEHNKDAFLALPPPPNSYKLPSAQGTDEPPVSDIRHQLERLLEKEHSDLTENTVSTQHPENPGKIEVTENSRNQAKCSACGSSRLRKNGKRGNAQKYICKDCGKNFSRGA